MKPLRIPEPEGGSPEPLLRQRCLVASTQSKLTAAGPAPDAACSLPREAQQSFRRPAAARRFLSRSRRSADRASPVAAMKARGFLAATGGAYRPACLAVQAEAPAAALTVCTLELVRLATNTDPMTLHRHRGRPQKDAQMSQSPLTDVVLTMGLPATQTGPVPRCVAWYRTRLDSCLVPSRGPWLLATKRRQEAPRVRSRPQSSDMKFCRREYLSAA